MAAQKKKPKKEKAKPLIIGVDGEGHDTPDGGHIYIYLAAVDETGRLVADAYNPAGLSLDECARMLLSLPRNALKFGFMFSYDVTKIIETLPLVDIYYLMRPTLRDETACGSCKRVFDAREAACPECGGELRHATRSVRYRGRKYDYFNGSLTVGEKRASTKVWDCFRFFGCAFVQALKDWAIGSEEQVARISAMKDKRGSFEVEDPENIKGYCREECHLLALMMRKVVDAHELAGIPLKRFDGAGSTATALLRAHEVADYKGPRQRDLQPELAHAIATAFFGGRFEDAVVGIVKKEVHGFDISSAYPFSLSALPCLRCGEWTLETKLTPKKLAKAKLCVAAFRVAEVSLEERKELAWCPLPFRDEKGSISYGTNFEGWAWAPELLAALRGWPELVSLTGAAWIYKTKCRHKPFAFLPGVYRKRVEWGKEGAGKALKLGSNASYGKTAQSIGDDPPFQSWVWAGMTTATTRGQLLDAICTAKDRWNVLTVATDGIYATEQLPIQAPPWDTGTGDLPKPLGGWEHKALPDGLFVVKPGVYYPLSGGLSDIRARGVGRREIYKAKKLLEAGFRRWDRRNPDHCVTLQSRRFYGAKHSILARSKCLACEKSFPGVPDQGCPTCREIGTQLETTLTKTSEGKTAYGTWAVRDVNIAFDPYPKREREGISRKGLFARLMVRDLGGRMSAAYKVGERVTTPEGQAQRDGKEIQLEQPDWDEGLTSLLTAADE